jgi:hypothetical protein
MLIYNVTIQVTHAIKDAWVEWMKTNIYQRLWLPIVL